jgi:hypothetical protein
MSDLLVKWDKMGAEFTYAVWYALKPEGPWIRHNAMRLTDDILDLLRGLQVNPSAPYAQRAYNEYIIDGLEQDTNYSVKVTCDDKYDSWWYSYSSVDSLEGGLAEPHRRPSPTGGNVIGFQIKI